MRPPDGGIRLELSRFVRHDSRPGLPAAIPNELGWAMSFEVGDLQPADEPAGRGWLWADRWHRPVRVHLADGLRAWPGRNHRVPGHTHRLTPLVFHDAGREKLAIQELLEEEHAPVSSPAARRESLVDVGTEQRGEDVGGGGQRQLGAEAGGLASDDFEEDSMRRSSFSSRNPTASGSPVEPRIAGISGATRWLIVVP